MGLSICRPSEINEESPRTFPDLCIVRLEEPKDTEAIRQVHLDAFPTVAEAQLVDKLRNNGKLQVSLVAILEGQIVGHIAFSRVKIGDGEHAVDGFGLGPAAVRKSFRNRGIGSSLVRRGLEECQTILCMEDSYKKHSGLIVVLGDPRFYSKFGFVAAEENFGITWEKKCDPVAFQALQLATQANESKEERNNPKKSKCIGTLTFRGGKSFVVRYSEEFNSVD